MAEKKSVRVRIAVAYDKNGTWNAAGWSDADEAQQAVVAVNGLNSEEIAHLVFVEADLPLPESPTVQGEVKEGGG